MKKKQTKYISFDKSKQSLNFDEFYIQIDSYLSTIEGKAYPDPLLFWKCHEIQFPQLAKLAKKYLTVPASSAAVKRMFSFTGHILTNRRRKTSPYLYSNLFFLKLNEEFFL